MRHSSFAVKAILIVNIAVFALSYLLQDLNLADHLAQYFVENDKFRVWQVVTSMFMHANLTHILFNMYGLWAFGTPLEQIWGTKRFLLFYFLCGIGAGIFSMTVSYFQFHSIYNDLTATGVSAADIQSFLNTEPLFGKKLLIPDSLSGFETEKLGEFWRLFNSSAVGASGAIYGVLVAFGWLFPNSKLALIFFPVPIAAKYFIPILIGLDLFSGVTGVSIFGSNIGYFAHVGGAFVGFLLMWLWRKKNNDVVIIQQ